MYRQGSTTRNFKRNEERQSGDNISFPIGGRLIKPYVIDQRDNKGLTAAILALAMPWEFYQLNKFYQKIYGVNYKKPNGRNLLFDDALRVLDQIKQYEQIRVCRFCGKETVVKFLLMGNPDIGYYYGPKYTCCESRKCIDELKSKTPDLPKQLFTLDYDFFDYSQKDEGGKRFSYPNPDEMKKVFRKLFPWAFGYENSEILVETEEKIEAMRGNVNLIKEAEKILYRSC